MEVTSRSEGVCRSDGYSKNGCKNENEDSKEKFSPFCSQKNSAILQPLGLTSPILEVYASIQSFIVHYFTFSVVIIFSPNSSKFV